MLQTKSLMDVFLHPGELFVADENFQIRTILGSCVSITLWHPKLRLGGMSHFLLPTRVPTTGSAALDGRYGDESLELLFRDLNAAGANPLQCEARIFGGGNMFPCHRHTKGQLFKGGTVGMRNGEAARELLRLHGIRVVTESLFGEGHRQVVFNVSKGEVWAKQVKPSLLEASSETADHGNECESN